MRYKYVLSYLINNNEFSVSFYNRSNLLFFIQTCLDNGYILTHLDILTLSEGSRKYER